MVLEIIVGVLSGLASAVTVFGFFRGTIDRLNSKIDALENDKIVKLECKLDKHIHEDQSQAILTELKKIEKMGDKLDRLLEENAEQRAQIKAQGLFLTNVDKALQSHKNGGHHHA